VIYDRSTNLSCHNLWSEDFTDEPFLAGLRQWLGGCDAVHDTSHARPLRDFRLPADSERAGRELAGALRRDRAIMGVFDEGCMGMYNAIIPDECMMSMGFSKSGSTSRAFALPCAG
jgi:hypothetical protein